MSKGFACLLLAAFPSSAFAAPIAQIYWSESEASEINRIARPEMELLVGAAAGERGGAAQRGLSTTTGMSRVVPA
jgi:hypothetical protein